MAMRRCERVGGRSDGFPQFTQPAVLRIIQTENDSGSSPAGLGQKPKRHQGAVIESLGRESSRLPDRAILASVTMAWANGVSLGRLTCARGALN